MSKRIGKKLPEEGVRIHGFSRVMIKEDDKVVGDTGFMGPNLITNLGFTYYLCRLIAASAGSLQIAYVALGTGGLPATDAITLPGEISGSTQRRTVALAYTSRANSTSAETIQFAGSFYSSVAFLAGASNISNIGLYNGTTTTNTLFAGNTYASSACNTNQDVYVTYQIRFS